MEDLPEPSKLFQAAKMLEHHEAPPPRSQHCYLAPQLRTVQGCHQGPHGMCRPPGRPAANTPACCLHARPAARTPASGRTSSRPPFVRPLPLPARLHPVGRPALLPACLPARPHSCPQPPDRPFGRPPGCPRPCLPDHPCTLMHVHARTQAHGTARYRTAPHGTPLHATARHCPPLHSTAHHGICHVCEGVGAVSGALRRLQVCGDACEAGGVGGNHFSFTGRICQYSCFKYPHSSFAMLAVREEVMGENLPITNCH